MGCLLSTHAISKQPSVNLMWVPLCNAHGASTSTGLTNKTDSVNHQNTSFVKTPSSTVTGGWTRQLQPTDSKDCHEHSSASVDPASSFRNDDSNLDNQYGAAHEDSWCQMILCLLKTSTSPPQVKLQPTDDSLVLYTANTFSFVLCREFLFSEEEAVNTLL